MLFIVVLYMFVTTNLCFAVEFSDVTASIVYGYNSTVIVAAFGDYNADKLVDMFVIDQSGHTLYVQNATGDAKKPFTELYMLYNTTLDDELIAGVMLADFDGDVQMDILVVLNRSSTKPDISVIVIWGNHSMQPYRFNSTFVDEPILFDYNADMLPDLLIEMEPGQRSVWLGTKDVGSFQQVLSTKGSHLFVPGSSAFIDLSAVQSEYDYAADLLLTTTEGFEVYSNGNVTNAGVKYPVENMSGALSFGDFNQDGVIDLVVPICDQQHKCEIRVYNFADGNWSTVLPNNEDWTFRNISYRHFNFQPTLHIGDYNMDGFPDALTVLSSPSLGHRAFLLLNVPCSSSDNHCRPFGRKFELQRNALPVVNQTLVATFYDINEDGTLDIVLTALVADVISPSVFVPKLVFLKNNLAADTCFLKVTVISGTCSSSSCHGRQPYGVNVPGPTVKYITITAEGNLQRSAAGQLSQSAHFALQLPYVVFGLGQTPNFVDNVGIGIPHNSSSISKNSRSRVWQQIIPNSQLVVIPSPADDPSRWKMKLFVTPSHQIVLTIIALGGTCVLVAIIVLVLHLRERREDSKEKKQESQKFHFDAM
jgi:integrin alpha FG-GAP repeat containing protein 1